MSVLSARVFKRLLVRGIRFLAQHKTSSSLTFLLTIALLLSLIGHLAEQPSSSTYTSADSKYPSPFVEEYLKGHADFNAKRVWNAMSQAAQRSALERGESIDTLQKQLTEIRNKGTRFEDAVFVGGYPLQDGHHLYFYVVSARNISKAGELQQIPFVFTVDRDGKISKVE